jgi:general secretion pathway protein A
MYERFFGLKEKAFNLTPDPEFLYLNSRTKEAFEDILRGIERREGFGVVIGDVGTGKTTMCCALLERIEGEKNIFTVLIQNPMLSEVDILRSILQDLGALQNFGTASTHDMSKKKLIDCLNTFLAENAREDAFTVLIIDESQNLSLDMLEQLRLLSNLETTKKKLIQILFLGQPELKQKLDRLRQLKQRISVWFEMRPLSREDTEKYIRHRLTVAGTPHRVQFGPGAFDAIYKHSQGYPRLINLVCDRGLREAFQQRSQTVTKQMVRKASRMLAGTRTAPLKSLRRRIQLAAAILVLILVAAASLLFFTGRRRTSVGEASGDLPRETAGLPAKAPQVDRPSVRPSAPALSTVPRPAPESRTKREYVLQVHTFPDADTAEQSAKELKALNLPSFVVHRAADGDSGWYGVYVGPFSELDAAQRADSEIRAATGAIPILRERIARERNAPPQ